MPSRFKENNLNIYFKKPNSHKNLALYFHLFKIIFLITQISSLILYDISHSINNNDTLTLRDCGNSIVNLNEIL
jgi:hypothetical protein